MDNGNCYSVESHLLEITESLKNGHAAIMIGSGFSKNADDGGVSGKKFPNWNELADIFYTKLHGKIEPEEIKYQSPTELAEEVESVFGRTVLNRIMIENIPNDEYKPSNLHKKLLELPWKDVFTTNYDTLLERASEQITQKRFNVIVRKEDLVNSANVTRIVKLHGTFPSNIPFIITNEDYRSYPKTFAPFVNTVQQSLLENTLCCIGFSCTDPNFQSWIGWIQDNLGKENSPKIYLIDIGPYSEGKKMLLYNKNVIVVNLAEWKHINGGYKEYLEEFLDYLKINSSNSNKWPYDINIDLLSEESLSNLPSIINQLKEQRLHYPGWVILPEKRRKYLKRELDSCLHSINILKIKRYDYEIHYLYEFNWLKEKCLQPLFANEIEAFEEILNRYSLNNADYKIQLDEESKTKWIQLKISLLRAYREIGNNDKWNKLNNYLVSIIYEIRTEQREQLSYEQCLCALFCLDITGLKQKLDIWTINGKSPLWTIRKAGLLAEVGDNSQAINMLQEILLNVRTQLNLSTNIENYKLLSLESCSVLLLGLINNSLENSKNPEENKFKSRNNYKDSEADLWDEKNYFNYKLSTQAKEYYKERIETEFDFGIESITNTYGADEEALLAFEYLRFYEDTGQPFRFKNVNNGISLEGAIQRISKYNSNWSIVSTIRSANKKGVAYIFSRISLSTTKMVEVDQLCRIYLNALKNMQPDIYSTNRWEINNISNISAQILPEILSRLCCKCSLEILDSILEFIKIVYNSGKCDNYSGMDSLVKRLINSYKYDELLERIKIFIEFPIFDEGSISERLCPDPIDFIEIYSVENTEYKIDDDSIDLLIQEGNKDKKRNGILQRLFVLYKLNVLSEKGCSQLSNLLWKIKDDKTGLPNVKNYYRSAYEHYPHPDDVDPRELWKIALLKDLENINTNIIKFEFTSDNTLVDEILQASRNRLFKDVKCNTIVINFCCKVWNICKNKSNNNMFNLRYKYSCKISKILANVIVHLNEKDISDEIKALITNIISEMKLRGIPTCALESVWNFNNEDIFNIIMRELLNTKNGRNIDVFDTIYMLIDNSERLNLDEEIIKSMVGIVVDQIIWRNDKNANYAIDIIVFLIKNHYEIIDSSLIYKIVIGLKSIINNTIITEDDSDMIANDKGYKRIQGARLAYMLSRHYKGDDVDIINIIESWKEICNDSNEFSEIRKQWPSK